VAKAARSGGSTPPAGKRGGGARAFLKESWAELRKVQWPTRQQVATGTLVVGVVTAVFALYITVVDQVAVRLIEQINSALGI
jgi:preprotein translocase subunit SecE